MFHHNCRRFPGNMETGVVAIVRMDAEKIVDEVRKTSQISNR